MIKDILQKSTKIVCDFVNNKEESIYYDTNTEDYGEWISDGSEYKKEVESLLRNHIVEVLEELKKWVEEQSDFGMDFADAKQSVSFISKERVLAHLTNEIQAIKEP
jgi:hypothetical protein